MTPPGPTLNSGIGLFYAESGFFDGKNRVPPGPRALLAQTLARTPASWRDYFIGPRLCFSGTKDPHREIRGTNALHNSPKISTQNCRVYSKLVLKIMILPLKSCFFKSPTPNLNSKVQHPSSPVPVSAGTSCRKTITGSKRGRKTELEGVLHRR